MWNKIVNPKTGRRVNISGKIGQQILQNYIIQLGGNRKTGPISWHLENETPFGLDDIEGEGDEHRKGRRGRTQVTPQMIRTSKHISADFQKRREENEQFKREKAEERRLSQIRRKARRQQEEEKERQRQQQAQADKIQRDKAEKKRKMRLELLREKKAAKDREYEREHPGELAEIKRLNRIKRQNARDRSRERSQARKPRPQNSLVHAAAFTAGMGLGHMLFPPRR